MIAGVIPLHLGPGVGWLLAAGLIALLALVAARILRGKAPAPSRLPYALRPSLLTEAELSFYRVLLQVPDVTRYLVFAKVRLSDVLTLADDVDNRQGALNSITSKHLDFVLCDRERLAPVLAIELDDSSHRQKRRQERDAFVDEALTAAGLPIWRVTCRREYAVRALAEQMGAVIRGGERADSSA